MKRCFLICLVILVLTTLTICAEVRNAGVGTFANSSVQFDNTFKVDSTYRSGSSLKNVSHVLGIDFPNFGWAVTDENGELTGYKGFNFGLGYSQKNYFEPYQDSKFNTYWGWGTVGLFVPYVNVGGDYAIPLDEKSNLNVGGGLMMVLFIPAPYFSVSYVW